MQRFATAQMRRTHRSSVFFSRQVKDITDWCPSLRSYLSVMDSCEVHAQVIGEHKHTQVHGLLQFGITMILNAHSSMLYVPLSRLLLRSTTITMWLPELFIVHLTMTTLPDDPA